MIRASDIPDEVVEAATKAILRGLACDEAIAAAINAWPGAEQTWMFDYNECIALPLPQTSDA